MPLSKILSHAIYRSSSQVQPTGLGLQKVDTGLTNFEVSMGSVKQTFAE